jgi:chemotaxis protein methyltransferase CheR
VTEADLNLLAEIVQKRAGLLLTKEAAYVAETRLGAVARAEELPSLEALMAQLRAAPSDALLASVTEALVDTDTIFFRDRDVWERLRTEVLPKLAAAKRGGVLRVWSAACGTGQEAYSLAMLGAETGVRLDVCASDLSERCLDKARAGVYNQFEVQRGLSAHRLLRFFDKSGDSWRIRSELRAGVRWRRFNLLDDTAPLGRFDLILCRNVLGRMSPEARGTVLDSVRRSLTPGAALMLGADDSAAPDMEEAAPGGRGLYLSSPGSAAA